MSGTREAVPGECLIRRTPRGGEESPLILALSCPLLEIIWNTFAVAGDVHEPFTITGETNAVHTPLSCLKRSCVCYWKEVG